MATHPTQAPRPARRHRALLLLLPGLVGTSVLAAAFALFFWLPDVFAPAAEGAAPPPPPANFPPGMAEGFPPPPGAPAALAAAANAPTLPDTEADAPGIRQPPARPASEADLGDGERVIGVAAGGRSRAYSVPSLSRGPASHVINDVLGGVPVTVTYCDVRDCARVFTSDTGGTPLGLSVGGFRAGGMVMKLDGRSYRQDTGAPLDADGGPAFPYRTLPAEETTWAEWRHAHPDTDLSVPQGPPEGFRPPPPRPGEVGLEEALARVPVAAIIPLPLLLALGVLGADSLLRSLRASRRRTAVSRT
jgi:hypothetical protein